MGLEALWEVIWSIIIGAWPLWVLLVAFIVFKVLGKIALERIDKKKIKDSGIEDVDQMKGEDFELFLETLFENMGYKVERTRKQGDYGADLIISKSIGKGSRTAVQAKRYNNKNVSVDAVQQAVAAKGYYGCQDAMVVTNSNFSKSAQKLANKNGVELWDRNKLMIKIIEIDK